MYRPPQYEKQVPGYPVQVDVKFLDFTPPHGKLIRRFQYTAAEEATRIRALEIDERSTQQNAIDFMNTVISPFPFRVSSIRTDHGYAFQA